MSDLPPKSPPLTQSEIDERQRNLLFGALQGLNAAKKGDAESQQQSGSASSLLRPSHVKRNDRTVSWDQIGGLPFRASPPSSQSKGTPLSQNFPDVVRTSRSGSYDTASHQSGDKLRVKDVQSTKPVEDQADTYILRALDQTDPTRDGISEAQKTILGLVPSDSKHQFRSVEEENAATVGHSNVSPKKNLHHRAPTTSETLWNLTAEMQAIQKLRDSFSEGNKNNESGMIEHNPTSDAETFANNAATLMLRSRSRRKEDTDAKSEAAKPQETETTDKKDPATLWRNLRQQVMVAGALNAKKGDDSDDGESHGNSVNITSDDDSGANGKEGSGGNKTNRRKSKKQHGRNRREIEADLRDFEVWLDLKKIYLYKYVKTVLLYWIFPCVGVAALLFYVGRNPPCGTQKECVQAQRTSQMDQQMASTGNNSTSFGDKLNFFKSNNLSEQASTSWWILFLGVRQVVTYSLARMMQAIFIDFMALRTRFFVRIIGPFLTLMIVQSRGWPCILFWWSVYDLVLLYGKGKFARHWLYFQDGVDLFNVTNPSGGITSDKKYLIVLCLAATIAFLASLKRVYIGIILGKQSFGRFAPQLTKVMKKCLFIGQAAGLALDIDKYQFRADEYSFEHTEAYNKTLVTATNNEYADFSTSKRSLKSGEPATSAVMDSAQAHGRLAGTDITGSIRIKIDEMLGEWEEPEADVSENETIPISSIIQFRQSLSYLSATFPFGIAFGQADTREHMVENAEKVYQRLLSAHPESVILNFDTLALLAIDEGGSLDVEKLKDLVSLFRPQRDGSLSLLDFAKSVDSVYREFRLLRASVANSTKLDRAFEKIVNIGFYFVLGCLALAILGIDPLVLFASVSGFILGFAFMIGTAAAKYFEGLLMIFVRRPYNIGDRINVSDVNTDTPGSGSPTWLVKDIDLFSTTVIYGSTNEVATLSNGAIASSKIINLARSKNANLWFLVKFPIDTPYEKIKIFRAALEGFVKDRPREWVAMLAFRATNVQVDLGYVEYITFCQHRESWQNTGACLDSKAELASFALEVSKKMGLRYRSPPMPVDLSFHQGASFLPTLREGPREVDDDSASHASQASYTVDLGSVAAMFAKDNCNG